MKETGTINNRDYLAFILAGGNGREPFRQITCAVDGAGKIVFSKAVERYGEACGGYNINITGPEGNSEIWMGEGNTYVPIVFVDPHAPKKPPIPTTPAEVLAAFQRWKASTGVREIITQNAGGIVREYCAGK